MEADRRGDEGVGKLNCPTEVGGGVGWQGETYEDEKKDGGLRDKRDSAKAVDAYGQENGILN